MYSFKNIEIPDLNDIEKILQVLIALVNIVDVKNYRLFLEGTGFNFKFKDFLNLDFQFKFFILPINSLMVKV